MEKALTLSKPLLWLLVSILGMSVLTHAQNVQTVRGQAVDIATNEPLPGVNVLIKGTMTGTSTDAAGKYSLTVTDKNAVLIFSYVGYEKVEVAVGSQTTLNVSLKPDQKSLDEIVVVGYGTQKKSDLTGAVATVSTKEITQLPVDRIEQGLQGRIPGVQVTQTSGAPGGALRVRVRGSNSIQYGNDPLYVIDGFPVGGSSVFVNPNDVESIRC